MKIRVKRRRFYYISVFVLAALAVACILVFATDTLKYQMVRGRFWRPAEVIAARDTIVIIDPMYKETKRNLLINPAYDLGDYVSRITNANVDVIHYRDATMRRVMRYDPACVLISGQTAAWTDYTGEDLENVFDFILNADIPVLGICGGHQLIAQAYGFVVAPMGVTEKGYIDVHLADGEEESPILKGLPDTIRVYSWHSEEIKELPPGMTLLGSSEICEIQAFQHNKKPVYGVQFHPEYTGRYPYGFLIMQNFLEDIAGIKIIK